MGRRRRDWRWGRQDHLLINLVYLLVPLYVLAMVLTFFSTEEFVNIAWDSAGVTTAR